MSRLTKKNNQGTGSWTQFGDEYIPAHNIKHKQCVNKLGKLEDLEQDLCCPLEIVLKIMLRKIDEIIVNYGDGGYGSPYTEYITANTSNIYYDIRKGLVIETNICDIPIKDYKVNWFLKENLSE